MRNPIREEFLIKDFPEFRERYGDTTVTIYEKSAPFLSEPMQKFVKLSPFCVVSSQDAEGHSDMTPRGDPAGLVEPVTPRVRSHSQNTTIAARAMAQSKTVGDLS